MTKKLIIDKTKLACIFWPISIYEVLIYSREKHVYCVGLKIAIFFAKMIPHLIYFLLHRIIILDDIIQFDSTAHISSKNAGMMRFVLFRFCPVLSRDGLDGLREAATQCYCGRQWRGETISKK